MVRRWLKSRQGTIEDRRSGVLRIFVSNIIRMDRRSEIVDSEVERSQGRYDAPVFALGKCPQRLAADRSLLGDG